MIQAYFNGMKSAVHGETLGEVNTQIHELEREYGIQAFGSYTLYHFDNEDEVPHREVDIPDSR